MSKKIKNLIVDTTAFIKNAPLQEIAENIITAQEVINEVTNKRQLKRLVVLPYDLAVKEIYAENIHFVTEFSKKTGDYRSLSSTDIKIIALTYQLEKQLVGIKHLRQEPVQTKEVKINTSKPSNEIKENVVGFFKPTDSEIHENEEYNEQEAKLGNEKEETELVKEKSMDQTEINVENSEQICNKEDEENMNLVMEKLEENSLDEEYTESESESDNDEGWITPNNIKEIKKQINSEYVEEKPVEVACITSDFSMQNVLRQIGLNVASLDGKIIKQVRTYIFRCYSCFKTTSIMTKVFCPTCGNQTLKRVAVTVDENGKQVIHINARKPLTARGKKFSLPTPKGGKHANNPILFEDQPRPDQRPTRLAKTKNDPLAADYIAGYSPFVMRDITSKSAMLGIRTGQEIKHWMRSNPNEARRKRK
ncbi:RNA-binding protein NOB1 [Chrysoperla carnea]|uniref:RNA-binding protein NOB1 n=1 Tax=Chrysoperla carnea TaxID=189513 RepID=UPI001D08F3C9|nr:RNA-binding protein NOB1 [Chrysoperla carnea]